MLNACVYIVGLVGGIFFLGNVLWQGFTTGWTQFRFKNTVFLIDGNPHIYWSVIVGNVAMALFFFFLAFGNFSLIKFIQTHHQSWDILKYGVGYAAILGTIRDTLKNKNKTKPWRFYAALTLLCLPIIGAVTVIIFTLLKI